MKRMFAGVFLGIACQRHKNASWGNVDAYRNTLALETFTTAVYEQEGLPPLAEDMKLANVVEEDQ